MILPSYAKSALSPKEQVKRLREKGMSIGDAVQAEQYLERIGYYHLSVYWHPFKENSPSVSSMRRLRAGTSFEDIVEFYQFDARLRNNLLFGLGRIEIGLRASLVNFLANISPASPMDLQNYKLDADDFLSIFGRIEKCWRRAKGAESVKNFKKKYAPPPTIWHLAETWDWGTLSFVIQKLKRNLANKWTDSLQKQAGVLRDDYFLQYDILTSWLSSLNSLRNYCAHQERVWNRDFTFKKPQKPKEKSAFYTLYPKEETIRLYHLIVIMCGLHRLVKIDTVWFEELTALLEHAPKKAPISYLSAGFSLILEERKECLAKLRAWME